MTLSPATWRSPRSRSRSCALRSIGSERSTPTTLAPGQACVFYDSAEGDARMLGGGFIRGTQAMRAAATETVAANL